MAIRILKNDLSLEDRIMIKKKLTITTKLDFLQKKLNYGKSPPNINFYITDDEYIYLPYQFGNTLLQDYVNFKLEKRKIHFNFTGVLLPHQDEIIKEAMAHLKDFKTTTLSTYPGSGKTIMGAWLSSEIWNSEEKEMTLVIHPRDILNTSWLNTYKEFTTAKVWVVGQKIPVEIPDIIISVDQSVKKIPKEWLNEISFLILDEAHMLCTESKVSTLLSTRPKYIVAETATLERTDDLHYMIYYLCGDHTIKKINSKPFRVLKINTNITPEVKENRMGMDWNSVIDSLINNESRNKLILKLIIDNLLEGWKIILLTARKKHVTILKEMIEKENDKIKIGVMMGNAKSYNDCDILLGTGSKIGVGFDEKMSCQDFQGIRSDLLIYCSTNKKEGVINQYCGRVLRADKPMIIQLVDNNPAIKRHWNIAKKWYSEHGGNIEELNISEEYYE